MASGQASRAVLSGKGSALWAGGQEWLHSAASRLKRPSCLLLISGPLPYLLKSKPEIQRQHLEASSCCFPRPWPTTLSPGIVQGSKQRHPIWGGKKKNLQATVQKAGFRTGSEIQLGTARVNHLPIFISNQIKELTVQWLLGGGWSQRPASLLTSSQGSKSGDVSGEQEAASSPSSHVSHPKRAMGPDLGWLSQTTQPSVPESRVAGC